MALEKGRQLVEDVDKIEDEDERFKIMELLDTLIAYKFNNLTQEELREMFGLDEFKKSRLYQDIYQEGEKEGKQEGKQETKLEMVDALFRRGFSVEDIADIVQLDIDTVRLRVQKVQDN
ncbi:conserved hypothetical protein [Gloeothece citriformis PCC 7424]|uniref:Uncharacterized protein n=1 Tax=Gloeothece citriformis (strain PCC 7424) TaxID=65393 RepID=B7KD74_GLOC7|nr:conserved hypothetical protein [Gloeothece citriformis PCC 7424]